MTLTGALKCSTSRMSSRTALVLLKNNHSRKMWLHNNRAHLIRQRQTGRASSPVEGSVERTTGDQVYEWAGNVLKANPRLILTYRAQWAGWPRALFPSLVNLKKYWSSQLDATSQIKETNGWPDCWCLLCYGRRPGATCLWRLSTINLSERSVKSFMDLLTVVLTTVEPELFLEACAAMSPLTSNI